MCNVSQGNWPIQGIAISISKRSRYVEDHSYSEEQVPKKTAHLWPNIHTPNLTQQRIQRS